MHASWAILTASACMEVVAKQIASCCPLVSRESLLCFKLAFRPGYTLILCPSSQQDRSMRHSNVHLPVDMSSKDTDTVVLNCYCRGVYQAWLRLQPNSFPMHSC